MATNAPDNDSQHPNRKIGCLIIVGLFVVAGLFWVLRTGAVLLLLLALVCFLSYLFVKRDDPPFASTRMGGVILIAWAADAILYRMALDFAPRDIRHISFGIIAVSVFVGWLAWGATENSATVVTRRADGSAINRMAPLTGVLLGVFLMSNVVHPLINRYFPSFWNNALGQMTQVLPSDDDQPEPP